MKFALDHNSVVKYVIELLGGHESAFKKFDAEHSQLTSVWEQNSSSIGRILRSHLFVEHFLSELLRAKNPALGPLDKARLTFAQKVSLVGSVSPLIDELVPGIRRLNKIRNRLAHSLHTEITTEDTKVLLNCLMFRAMRNEGAKNNSQVASKEPIDIVEAFAMHVGMIIQASVSGSGEVWSEAIRLAQEEATNCE